MFRIRRLHSWFVVFGVLAALLGAMRPRTAHGGDTTSIDDTITRLVRTEEFKAEELEELAALPMESVPLLTQRLLNIPSGGRYWREFKMLAAKVTQFEPQLKGTPMLDDAVGALLARIRPEDHETRTLKAQLRGKLKDVAFIKDPRIYEGVRKARVFLGLEQEIADQSQNLPKGSGAKEVSQAARDPKIHKTSAAGTNEKQPSMALWPVWTIMAVAAIALLWLLLKNRKKTAGT